MSDSEQCSNRLKLDLISLLVNFSGELGANNDQIWLPMDLDFIECFMTTFLRAHSWLNWVDEDDDEDEVGLKEKPEDTRYIKKITSK